MTMTLKDWVLTVPSSSSSPSILLMDGGVSTHLEELLLEQGKMEPLFAHRSLWSSSLLLTPEGRDTILSGHLDWLNVGCNILTTVTYQCHYGISSSTIKNSGLPDLVVTNDEMTQMIQDGIRLAMNAIDENDTTMNKSLLTFVVASSGCHGAAMADGSEYTGKYPVGYDELVEFHTLKVKTLLAQSPHGLAMETIPNLQEVSAVCDVLAKFNNNNNDFCCCHWISLACQDKSRLNDGNLLVDALETLQKKDPLAKVVHVIGINCCDSQHVLSLVEIVTRHIARHGPRRGIAIYPNSGEAWDAQKETWKEGTGCQQDEFAQRMIQAIQIVHETWKKESTTTSVAAVPKLIVGGCCRTKPSTIAALRNAIDVWEEERHPQQP